MKVDAFCICNGLLDFRDLILHVFLNLCFVAIFDVDHVEDFETFLMERLQERRRGDSRNALICNVVDVILALLRAV